MGAGFFWFRHLLLPEYAWNFLYVKHIVGPLFVDFGLDERRMKGKLLFSTYVHFIRIGNYVILSCYTDVLLIWFFTWMIFAASLVTCVWRCESNDITAQRWPAGLQNIGAVHRPAQHNQILTGERLSVFRGLKLSDFITYVGHLQGWVEQYNRKGVVPLVDENPTHVLSLLVWKT